MASCCLRCGDYLPCLLSFEYAASQQPTVPHEWPATPAFPGKLNDTCQVTTMNPTMQEILLVLTNMPDEDAAVRLARSVLEQRLAACVNILGAVRSVYRWQGAIESAAEVPLLMKTTADRYAELEAAIRCEHPYEIPEIVAFSVSTGLQVYLDWVVAETRRNVDV